MTALAAALRAISLAVVAVALWWVAHPAAQNDASYYPLSAGMNWEYELTNTANPDQPVRLRVVNSGRQRVGTWNAAVQRLEAPGAIGFRYVFSDGELIALVAEQNPGKSEPSLLEKPSPILRLPVEVGKSWESETTSTAFAPGVKLPVTATIESVGDHADSGIGSFENCVRVSSQGKVRIAGDLGSVEVRIDSKLWYAPGVGLVHLERRESIDRAEIPPVEMKYRLVARNT